VEVQQWWGIRRGRRLVVVHGRPQATQSQRRGNGERATSTIGWVGSCLVWAQWEWSTAMTEVLRVAQD